MLKGLPALIATLVLFLPVNSYAGEISVYKDKNGVINLTDKPAPAGVQVQQVIRFSEKSAAEMEAGKKAAEQKRRTAAEQAKAAQIRDLAAAAARARDEAENERGLAQAKTIAAEAYLERYNQEGRSQRRRLRQAAKRIALEAEKAQARANAAIARANQAQEALRKASAVQADISK